MVVVVVKVDGMNDTAFPPNIFRDPLRLFEIFDLRRESKIRTLLEEIFSRIPT